jgi:hypothetical protein
MKKHANQVAAFEKLLGHCNAQGARFNPSNESMNSTALTTLLTEAQKSIQAVHNAQNDLVDTINIRNRAFDKLPLLGTRIISGLVAIRSTPDHIADVNRIRKRFRFQPPKDTALKNGSGGQAVQTNGDAPSATTPRGPISRLGFNQKIETMAEMIGLLKKHPYATNEVELTIERLEALLVTLREKHKDVGAAHQALYNAREHRNKMLFHEDGIHGTSLRVKKYFGSAFGTKSEQHRVVSKIKFFN